MAMDWHMQMVEDLRAAGHVFAGLQITDKDARTVAVIPAPGVTQEQADALAAAIAAYPLIRAREARAAAMFDAYAADLADGVTVGQLTLLAGASDQIALANGLTMLNSALLVGVVSAGTMISAVLGRTVTDAAGASHDMTVGDYIALCLGYGQAIGAMQAQRNAKLAAIAEANTVEAVNAINW